MAKYDLDTNRTFIREWDGTYQDAKAYLIKWLLKHRDQFAYIRKPSGEPVAVVLKATVETKKDGKNYYDHFFAIQAKGNMWRYARLNKKGQVCSSWDWSMADQGTGYGKISYGWHKPVHKNAIKVKGSY